MTQLDSMIRRMLREGRRPRGEVRIYRCGKEFFRGRNLFVNAGLPALAKLMAGLTSGEYALAVGFGSGSTAPALTDTDLTGPTKYYNAVGSNSEDGNGSVTFEYALIAGTDTGAYGMTVAEVGLFANLSSVGLPGTTPPHPMLAHALVPAVVFTSAANYAGTWTFTF
jgi:hypothetical protein